MKLKIMILCVASFTLCAASAENSMTVVSSDRVVAMCDRLNLCFENQLEKHPRGKKSLSLYRNKMKVDLQEKAYGYINWFSQNEQDYNRYCLSSVGERKIALTLVASLGCLVTSFQSDNSAVSTFATCASLLGVGCAAYQTKSLVQQRKRLQEMEEDRRTSLSEHEKATVFDFIAMLMEKRERRDRYKKEQFRLMLAEQHPLDYPDSFSFAEIE